MAESTLSPDYDDIAQEIAWYAGWGRDFTKWGAVGTVGTNYYAIDAILQAGLRQFYYPPPIGGTSHTWSFLRPVDDITTTADDHDYDFEENYGGIIGDLTFQPDDSKWITVPIIGEGQWRGLYQRSDSTGSPKYACVRPKAATEVTGQRFELLLWPVPDGEYKLYFQKIILPQKLATTQYPLGGMAHGETIIASCLAMAEDRLNDKKAEKSAAFLERLAASIRMDQKANAPEWLGYNADRSSNIPDSFERVTSVTVNDVQY